MTCKDSRSNYESHSEYRIPDEALTCFVIREPMLTRLNLIYIYVKKLQFIHTGNGAGSKTAKIIKGTINHTNIA